MELWGVWGEAQLLIYVRLRSRLHPSKHKSLDAAELDLCVLVSFQKSLRPWNKNHREISAYSGTPAFTCW